MEHVSNYQLCSKSVLCDAVIDPHLAPTIPNGSDVRLKFKWISADRTSAATCLFLVFNPPYQGMDQRRLCEWAAVFSTNQDQTGATLRTVTSSKHPALRSQRSSITYGGPHENSSTDNPLASILEPSSPFDALGTCSIKRRCILARSR